MSGPVQRPLTVTESDGSPEVRPCSQMVFDSADFVLAKTGNSVRINNHPGAGASLTDTYVGFGSASDLLTGSANMTYNETLKRFTLRTDGNDDIIRLICTDTDANAGPIVLFRRDTGDVGAAGDDLGQISFNAEDAAGNDTSYVKMYAEIADATASQESGRLYFRVRQNNSYRTFLKMEGATSGSTGDDDKGTVIWNEDAQDIDMRWEGTSNANAMKFDAENECFGIGGAPDSGVERLHVQGTGDGTLVRLESTDTGAGSAPELNLYRSATAATNDVVGQIRFQAKSATGSINITAATFYTKLKAVSGTAMDSELFCDIRIGNASKNMMKLGNTEVVFNDDSADVDFRIESDGNVDMFKLDSGNNNIGIATAPNSNTVLHILDDGSKSNTVRIESTDNDASVGPVLDIRRNNADGTATDGDNLGVIQFTGLDDGGGAETYARIRATAADTHSTQAEGAIEFLALYNGVETEVMRIGPVGDGGAANFGVDINYNSQSTVDFRVRGDNVTNLMYIDVSVDKVGVGAYPASGGAQFQVNESASFVSYLANQNTTGIVDASLQKNGHIICNPSGGNIVVTLGGSGGQGEKVTITNVAADGSNVLFAVAVGDSTLTTPATFVSGDTQTWLCYKDLNWVMINSET